MTQTPPLTLLAQWDEVFVFQTAAFGSYKVKDANNKKSSRLRQQQANYGELNLGLHVGDTASKVLDNRLRLLTAINAQLAAKRYLPINKLHWVDQVHGEHIDDVDKGVLTMQPVSGDAMISQYPHTGLAIMTADCVPMVLYQPTSGQIAAIHAGWQGLARGIVKATAQRFSASGPINAWMGACICQTHYEVGVEVRDQLLAGCIKNTSLPPKNMDSFDLFYSQVEGLAADCPTDLENGVHNVTRTPPTKVYINLPKLAADQLSAAGITLCNALPVECSYANEQYYSYRRQTHLQQPATGRMALVIVRSACQPHDTQLF